MKTRTILYLAIPLLVLALAIPTVAQEQEPPELKDAEAAMSQRPLYLVAPMGTAETEPNDTPAQASALVAPFDKRAGDITPAGDIDWWVMGGADVDDLVFAYVDASTSSTGVDTLLNVYAHDTTTLIEGDDDSGPGLSSVVAGAVVPQADDVYYCINEFNNDGEITPYLLFVTVLDPTTDSAAETEPNDTWGTATAVSAQMMTGSVPSDDVDYYSFIALAGDNIAVSMDDDPENDGNAFDSGISILDTDGTTVLADGDNNSGNHSNAAGAVTIPADGTYFLRVEDGGLGADTTYRFVIYNRTVVIVDVYLPLIFR